MSLLTCTNLCLGYDGREMIRNLNLEIYENDYLVILGENGCGKSSLMRTFLGLQAPISGEIQFGNGLLHNQIGYLPQQSKIQKDFPASVGEIVISGFQGRCGPRPFYNRSEKRIADENMEKLEILSLKKRCFRELSGGQQQRVLLARALCAAKMMLLLDEPTGGLDPQGAADFYGVIEELHRNGMAIVMITHDLQNGLKSAGRVLRLGKNSFCGTKADYESFFLADRDVIK